MAPAIQERQPRRQRVQRTARGQSEPDSLPWTRGDDDEVNEEPSRGLKQKVKRQRIIDNFRPAIPTVTEAPRPTFQFLENAKDGRVGPVPMTTFIIDGTNGAGDDNLGPPGPPGPPARPTFTGEPRPQPTGGLDISDPESNGEDDSDSDDETSTTQIPTSTTTTASLTLPTTSDFSTISTATEFSSTSTDTDFSSFSDLSTATDYSTFSTATRTSTETGTLASDLAEPLATVDEARASQKVHHRNMETALTAVGSIAGAVLIATVVWFIWRYKKRRRNGGADAGGSGGKDRASVFIRDLPFLKKTWGEREWTAIDSSRGEMGEKSYFAPSMPKRPESAAVKPASIVKPIVYAPTRETSGKGRRTPPPPLNLSKIPKDSEKAEEAGIKPIATQVENAETGRRESEASSALSSAFGNGTFMIPTPKPKPAAKRESIQTDASTPRFRTVESWVKHQAGRARGKVPEQGFDMMLPDGERVRKVVAPNGVGFVRSS